MYPTTPPPPPPMGAPYPSAAVPPGDKPDSYLVWAILTTILCCLPLGVASIVYAARVDGAWAAGRWGEARAYSQKAKRFAIWSAAASAALVVLYIVAVAALGGAAM